MSSPARKEAACEDLLGIPENMTGEIIVGGPYVEGDRIRAEPFQEIGIEVSGLFRPAAQGRRAFSVSSQIGCAPVFAPASISRSTANRRGGSGRFSLTAFPDRSNVERSGPPLSRM